MKKVLKRTRPIGISFLLLALVCGGLGLNPSHASAAEIQQYTGGLLVFADGTAGTPKYMTFDDTTGFGSKQSASSVGANAIDWIRVAASPVNDEWIIVTKDTASVIKAQVCTGINGGVSCGTPTTITSSGGTATLRNFDVAYEYGSGDALIVYGTNTADELRKIEWTGGSWQNDAAITTTRTSGTVQWVALTSRGGSSDQIGIAYADSNQDVSAYRWNGTSAADEATAAITATATAGNCQKMDVSFEGASGDMFVASPLAAAGTVATGALSGTTWTITTATAPDVITGCVELQKPNPSDDDIGISTYGVANPTLSEGFEWSGSGITDGNNGDDTIQTWAADYKLTAISYMSTTYYAVAVISNAATPTDIDWWTMNSGGTITDQAVNARASRGNTRQLHLYDYPNNDKVILFTADANNDLWADTWDGAGVTSSAWTDLTSGGALETSLGTVTTDDVAFAFRLAQNLTAPVITTDAVTPGNASATLNGTITNTGGQSATERGFAWGTDPNLSGGDTSTTTESGSFGTGAFTQPLLNLISNTKYYYRAYATNPIGTGYGSSIQNFTTSVDTTPGRAIRLFEGFLLKIYKGARLIIHQR